MSTLNHFKNYFLFLSYSLAHRLRLKMLCRLFPILLKIRKLPMTEIFIPQQQG